MRRSTLRWLWLAPLAATLAACGGDSGGGGCRTATAPTSGPGDTLAHFPTEVGRSWQYQLGTGGTVSLAVTGTVPVGTETAAVFVTSTSADPTPSSEWLVKRPWGAYVVDDGSADPALAGTYPELVIPFPVQVTETTELARCTNVDAGDLDSDGRGDRADVVETLSVVSITDTAVVPAGTFTDLAHVRKDLQMTVRSSSSGSLTVLASMDDWYAPGVGRVESHRTITVVGGGQSSDTIELVSYALPSPLLASPGPGAAGNRPPARLAARPGEPRSFEAAAHRLADAILGWPR